MTLRGSRQPPQRGPVKTILNSHLKTLLARTPKGINVLGICSTGHGAALALVSSEYGIRALTLDRFTGQKHSLLFCREELADILAKRDPVNDEIYGALHFSYCKFPPAFVFEDFFIPFLKALLHGLPLRPRHIDLVVCSPSHFAVNPGRLGPHLNRYFPHAEIHNSMEHHHAHQCQAFLASPFADSALLTLDQSGEMLPRLGGKKIALSLAVASGTSIEVLKEHTYPESSPGQLYDTISQQLGFYSGQEGKTMGLAPYGTNRIYRDIVGALELHEDGSFTFPHHREFEAILARYAPVRKPEEALTPVHADIAYAGQTLLEDILINAVQALGRLAPARIKNLGMAGGVALNSVANEKLFRASRFSQVYIMPNANDDGHALGCALYGFFCLRGQTRPVGGVVHDYLGPAYDRATIETALQGRGLVYEKLADRARTVAGLLEQGLIVGWFQGGSEFGPRALGNRSILADPRPAAMKNHLNHEVKHREPFRPFAPVVLEEKASDWFDLDGPSKFMLRVVAVRPEKREEIAAVTHVDGTARVQTVNRLDNSRLYELIEAFALRTGVPVLLNTSFNVAGRPIVETPDDAIDCFLSTGIDALVLDDLLVQKRPVDNT